MPKRKRKGRSTQHDRSDKGEAPVRTGRVEAMANAMLEDALMKETAAYLSRGRRHSTKSDDDVKRGWTAAFKGWRVAASSPDAQREMDDLAAELRLRRLEPPYDAVEAEMEAMRQEIERAGPDDPGIKETIDKFLDSLATAKKH